MDVWAEIYDPTYTNRVGSGPLHPVGCGFDNKLDEAGTGQANFAFEERAFDLLRVRRICELWLSELTRSGVSKRRLGAFVIDSRKINHDSATIAVRGPGVLSLLRDKITLPGLAYENLTIAQALTALSSLAGWTVDTEAALNDSYISVRQAGDNVQRAISVICQEKGVHFRIDPETKKQIQAGAFGDNEDNVWAEYVEGDGGELDFDDSGPIRITNAEIVEESNEIVNYMLAMGGGDGDAALTMQGADRSFVESVTANGRTHYILRDNASIKLYGQIERRVNFKRINPTDATDSAVQYAKDALADGAKAYLDRHSQPYEKLNFNLQNVRDPLQPGNKIHIRYKGWINRDGVPYQWRDIDDDYWIMSVQEQAGSDGLGTSIEVANIDRYQTESSDIVVGMMDAINVEHVNIQPYPALYPFGPFQNPIDTDNNISMVFPIFNNVVRVNSVKMVIVRSVFTATGGVAAAGGDHRHLVFTQVSTKSLQDFVNTASYRAANNSSGGELIGTGVLPSANVNDQIWTQGASGTHTHDLEFDQVVKDTLLPRDLSVQINGFNVASGIFPDDTDSFIELDVTAAVLQRPGGIRGLHDVTVSCGSQRGDLAIVFYLDVDVSRVRTS